MSTETADPVTREELTEGLEKAVRALAVFEATILHAAEARRDQAERTVMELQGMRHEIEDLVGIDNAKSDQILGEARDRADELIEA